MGDYSLWLLADDLGRDKLVLLVLCMLSASVLSAHLRWRLGRVSSAQGESDRRGWAGRWLGACWQLCLSLGIPLGVLMRGVLVREMGVPVTLVEPAARARVVDWQTRAQRLVAEFRADCGSYLDDPWLRDFITDLQTASAEFAGWWDQHDVLSRDGGTREFDHPALGRLTTQQITLRLNHTPATKLVVHILLDDNRDRLAAQMSESVDNY